MINLFKYWIKKNWKSFLCCIASLVIWILVTEDILDISSLGYLLFGSIEYNGASDVTEITHNSSFTPTDFTVSLWFKTSDASVDGVLIDKRTNHFAFKSFVLIILSQYLRFFVTLDGSTWAIDLISDNTVSNNVWYHTAAIFASGNQKLYVNAVEQADSQTTSGSISWDNSEPLRIGGGNSVNEFIGKIDEVYYWNAVLNQSDINKQYESKTKFIGREIKENNIIELWGLDDGPDGTSANGDTVKGDQNGFNGTNIGGIWRAEEVLSYKGNPIYVPSSVSVTPEAIMNQFQGPNLGADLFDGALI